MKLAQVNLKHVIPGVGAFSTACLKADKGHELTYDAGLVTAKKGEDVLLIPLGNVLGMKPLATEAKPAKK